MSATGKYLKVINSSGATESIPIYWDKESMSSFCKDYVRIGGINTDDGYMYLPALKTNEVSTVMGQKKMVIDSRPNFHYKVPSSGGTYYKRFEEFNVNMLTDGYLSAYIDFDMYYNVSELPHIVFYYRIDDSMSLTENAPSGETAVTHFFGNDMMSGCWKYRDWGGGERYGVVLVNNDIWLSAGTHKFVFGVYWNASADDNGEATLYRYTLKVMPKYAKCSTTSVHAVQNGQEYTLVVPE